MAIHPAHLPDDIATLKAMIVAANARTIDLDGQIAHLKLTIAKMQRDTHGASSERGARLLDQMELQLDELIATVAEGKTAAAIETPLLADTSGGTNVKPARRGLPPALPRERVVHAAPCTCRHCGSERIRKLGEQVTETLELVPASWKVIQHVRETFTCRVCEKITETPAPSHPIARGRAGPQLLAHILFSKYRAHLPLNRQSDIYEKEGIDLDVSTLADCVGFMHCRIIYLICV
jgi:transposase